MTQIFLSYASVCERTMLSRQELWRLLEGNVFVEPIEIAPNEWVWREDEIDAWIDARPVAAEFLDVLVDRGKPKHSRLSS